MSRSLTLSTLQQLLSPHLCHSGFRDSPGFQVIRGGNSCVWHRRPSRESLGCGTKDRDSDREKNRLRDGCRTRRARGSKADSLDISLTSGMALRRVQRPYPFHLPGCAPVLTCLPLERWRRWTNTALLSARSKQITKCMQRYKHIWDCLQMYPSM